MGDVGAARRAQNIYGVSMEILTFLTKIFSSFFVQAFSGKMDYASGVPVILCKNGASKMLLQIELPARTGKIYRRYCLPAVSADHPWNFTCGSSVKLSTHLKLYLSKFILQCSQGHLRTIIMAFYCDIKNSIPSSLFFEFQNVFLFIFFFDIFCEIRASFNRHKTAFTEKLNMQMIFRW